MTTCGLEGEKHAFGGEFQVISPPNAVSTQRNGQLPVEYPDRQEKALTDRQTRPLLSLVG